MSFEGVGLTPADRYWVYVEPQSHRVVRWDMLLEDQSGEPTAVRWEKYQDFGPLSLATERNWPDGTRQIVFENIEVRLVPTP